MEARGKERDVAVSSTLFIVAGERRPNGDSGTIGPVPDKRLLFEAPEFLATPCQVTCERVRILTFRDLWLWTGELFVANGGIQ